MENKIVNQSNYQTIKVNQTIYDPKRRLCTGMQICEILLMAAEANYRTGNAEQVIACLNQIRQRNGLENVSSATEETLLNAWQNKLKNEGLYFSALKRFGKATQMLNIPEYKLLLPILSQEIVANPNMTQNLGW